MQKQISTLEDYAKCNQSALLNYLNTLSPLSREKLTNQLLTIDINNVYDIYQQYKVKLDNQYPLQPVKKVLNLKDLSETALKEYENIGMKTISLGKVCLAMMAGGQGTRLGFDKAKGMYDIGLPSQKSLFQIYCERILRLQNLVHEKLGKCLPLQFFIMTSDVNHEETTQYFADNKYFGLDQDQITFFQQDSLPILSSEGQILLNSPTSILEGPDGNGGIFTSLYKQGYLDYMKCLGIELIQICPVDNVLCKLADPIWIGYTKIENLTLCSKFVQKVSPSEKVGIHALVNGRPFIREYSEMSEKDVQLVDQNGQLVFNAGSLAQVICTVDFAQKFLTDPATRNLLAANYHAAQKKYEYYDFELQQQVKPTQNNALKFELFYFDCFPICPMDQFGMIEADRQEEFAPVKNAPAEKTDTPLTAKTLYLNRNKKWLKQYGYQVDYDVEISEHLSYKGEGLEQILKSYKNQFPNLIVGEKKLETAKNSRVSENPQSIKSNQIYNSISHQQKQSQQYFYQKQQQQIQEINSSQNMLIIDHNPKAIQKAQTQLKFVNKSAFPTYYQMPLSQYGSQVPAQQQQLQQRLPPQQFFQPKINNVSPRQTIMCSPQNIRQQQQYSPIRQTSYVVKQRATTTCGRQTMFVSPNNQRVPSSLIQSISYTQPIQQIQVVPQYGGMPSAMRQTVYRRY